MIFIRFLRDLSTSEVGGNKKDIQINNIVPYINWSSIIDEDSVLVTRLETTGREVEITRASQIFLMHTS